MSSRALRRTLAALVTLASVVALACAPEEDPGPPASPTLPVVLIGVDGLEWRIALPLLERGELPALRDLMARGSFGRLETLVPTRSPAIWTTVATGKTPEAHGIPHFVRRDDGRMKLYTSRDRRTKALWNILSERGDLVHCVGWWMTWPVEPVSGVMVAQTNTRAQIDTRYGRQIWKGGVLEGVRRQAWPPEREAALFELARGVEAELPAIAEQRFGRFAHPLAPLEERLWQNTLWSLRADTIYLRSTLELLARPEGFDVAMVYFGLPDVVGHRFYRYFHPDLFDHPPRAEALANFADAIPAAYRAADDAIGAIVAASPPDTTFVVVSDHGMLPINTDREFPADAPPRDVNSGAHPGGPPGVFVAAGPRVARGDLADRDPGALSFDDLPTVGSVVDVAPTVLALRGQPVGRDMAGEVLDDVLARSFRSAHPWSETASHDTPGWRDAMAESASAGARTPEAETERIEQLRALGYLDD